FEERPRGGGQEAGAHGCRRRDARLEPSRRGGEEREKGAEEERGERRQRERHAAEGMQADIDPGHTRAEQSEAEGVSRPERVPRRRGRPGMDEEREREQRERKVAERREREHRRRARDKR